MIQDSDIIGSGAAVISQRRCDQITECRLIARGESHAGFSISESPSKAEAHDRRPESILGDLRIMEWVSIAQRTVRCRSLKFGGPVFVIWIISFWVRHVGERRSGVDCVRKFYVDG